MSWKPTLTPGLDVRTLPLSVMQGFVLSRVDGATDVTALAQVTGLTRERVTELLNELVTAGALQAGPEVTTPNASPDAEATGANDEEALEAPDDAEDPALVAAEGTHRQLYESRYRTMTENDRVSHAGGVGGSALEALCFDPLPRVIQSLLDNPHFALQHARLVATHHRNPVGLEALAARAQFAADLGVRRALVRNPQLPASLYRRLWTTRRMHEQHLVVINRDVPEQTRRAAREVLRTRFASGPSEEKVELIVKTEGRCLTSLLGVALDSKSTALLCGRSYASTLFVQNLARWSATPPQLIAHLLRQDVVKRSPMLRTLLERHPNTPKG
ncbi:MAG: hypothetical protein Q8S33_14525 [Myxococcales bacterium]|nr:hypothetical protein [Myxococcales bacterium]